MAQTEQLLLEISGAVDQLSRTARAEQDTPRGTVARNLAARFSGVTDRAVLRVAAGESLAMFRSGLLTATRWRLGRRVEERDVSAATIERAWHSQLWLSIVEVWCEQR